MPIAIDAGRGPAVVLLHGFCENSHIWDKSTGGLLSGFRVLAVDLPGHANSPLNENVQSLSDVAGEVISLLDAEEVDRFAVIGHSLGGYVALAMLEAVPERIAGLGLFHSTALADSPEKKRNRSRTATFIRNHGDSAFKKNFIPSLYHAGGPWEKGVSEMIDATPQETIIRYTMMMRDRPDRMHLLSKGGTPALLVAGKYDAFIPLASLEQQAAEIPGASLEILDNSGHLGMLEEADKSGQIINRFAKSCL